MTHQLDAALSAAERYQRAEIASRIVAAMVARTPHGATGMGAQQMAVQAVGITDALLHELGRPTETNTKKITVADAIRAIRRSKMSALGYGEAIGALLQGWVSLETLEGILRGAGEEDGGDFVALVQSWANDQAYKPSTHEEDDQDDQDD